MELPARRCSLGLTGCTPLTQPSGAGSTPPPSKSAQPVAPEFALVWADGTEVTANERSIDEAREATKDKDFTEVFSTVDMKTAETAFVPLGVEASGTPVGLHGTRLSEEEFEETGNRIDPESMQIGRYVGKSFEPFTTSGALKKKYIPHGITSISVTDAGIIWSENFSRDPETGGWRILGVSPGTTDVRVLATQTPLGGQETGWDPQTVSDPILVNERVYWNSFQPHDAEGSAVYKMLSVDFKKPAAMREELGPDGADRQSDGENLYTWGDGLASVAEVQDDSDLGISQTVSAYLPGEERREILHLERLEPLKEEDTDDTSRMALRGSDGQVLSVVHGGDLFLVDPDTRQTELFRGPELSQVVGVTHCGTRISWTYAQESEDMPTERYVFDRDSNELTVVPDAQQTGAGYCTGDYIGWSPVGPEGSGADTWDVVTRWAS